MASSSAPNIFSASMSFSLETCRITDGSMFIGPYFSSSATTRPSLAAAPRPLEFQTRLPNIAETDIIGFAILPINDTEDVPLDALERSPEVPAPRRRLRLRFGGLREDRLVGLHPDAPTHEPAGVVDRVVLAIGPGRGDLERVPVTVLVGSVEESRDVPGDRLALLDRDGASVFP